MPGTNISYKAIIKSLVPLKVQCPLPTIGLELYQPAGGTLQGKKVSSNCYVSIGKHTSRITRTRKWIPPFVDTEKNSFSMCAKVSYVQFYQINYFQFVGKSHLSHTSVSVVIFFSFVQKFIYLLRRQLPMQNLVPNTQVHCKT